jgi:hypothetical protein
VPRPRAAYDEDMRRITFVVALVSTWAAVACGSSYRSSEPTPSDPLLDASQTRTEPIVRVSSAGVSPQNAHLDAPITVTFINGDSVAHRFEAAPELRFGDCPEMAQLGTLAPGEVGTVTIRRTVVICAYHDGGVPTSAAFQGLLVVH